MTPQPRVQVTNRTWVSPSVTTPPQKRRTPLSDWDIVMFKSYTPLLLFYTNDSKDPDFMNTNALTTSLATVLVDFYPLAGRLIDIGNGRDEIDNCDEGVLFQVINKEKMVYFLLFSLRIKAIFFCLLLSFLLLYT